MQVMRRHSDRVMLEGTLSMSAGDVFAAFTDPGRLVTWWPEQAEVDLRVGGAYVLTWPEQDWTLRGRYLEVHPPTRLRFTWSWDHEETPERTVTLDIAESGGLTVLTIDQTCGSQEEGQSYIDGWQFFVSRLAS